MREDRELYEYMRVDLGLSEKWATSLIRRKKKFVSWLEERGKPSKPEEIRKIDLRDYFDYIKEEYAPSTVRKRVCSVRRWLKFNDIDTMQEMQFNIPQQGRIERPYYSPEEANKIWRTAAQMGKKHLALISVNLGMGLRNIGAYRLKWSNVDLEKRTATVIGKAQKKRDLVIPERVTENLKQWKKLQHKKHDSPKWIFTKSNGERPKREKTLTDWLNRILDRAEIDTRDGFRAGRRTFGRDLYKATDHDLRTVSQYLGHENPTQTLEYLQLEDYDQREKIEQLDNMMKNLIYPELKAGPEE